MPGDANPHLWTRRAGPVPCARNCITTPGRRWAWCSPGGMWASCMLGGRWARPTRGCGARAWANESPIPSFCCCIHSGSTVRPGAHEAAHLTGPVHPYSAAPPARVPPHHPPPLPTATFFWRKQWAGVLPAMMLQTLPFPTQRSVVFLCTRSGFMRSFRARFLPRFAVCVSLAGRCVRLERLASCVRGAGALRAWLGLCAFVASFGARARCCLSALPGVAHRLDGHAGCSPLANGCGIARFEEVGVGGLVRRS